MTSTTTDRIISPASWGNRDPVSAPALFEPHRRQAAKRSYTTSRICLESMTRLVVDVPPRAGDLVLARVTRLRQHRRLESPEGRRAHLYRGDEILACFGDRYAPDQFEGRVPRDLGPCHLVAAGGVAARMTVRNAGVKTATEIEPIGLVADDEGRILNLRSFRLVRPQETQPEPLVVAVVGSSMNAGKTTTAAACIHGLMLSGMRVGAAKVTGTGAGGDRWQLLDAGAAEVLDFTDVGYASTYQVPPEELCQVFVDLIDLLAARRVDVIVLEVADGLFQAETAALLRSAVFRRRVGGLFFAAADAFGATAGVDWLRREDLPVLGVSGMITRSPLACREAEQQIDVPILTRSEVSDPVIGRQLQSVAGLRQVNRAC